MKAVLALLGLIFAVSAYEINLEGGYKRNARYIYHYEARIRPAQISNFKQQFIELLVKCTVEIHPVSHEKFFLQITKHNVTARLSDPKFTNGTVDYISYGELGDLSAHIKKPIKFKYRNGMVDGVYVIKDDARFSVNIKKGIINLFHVDMNGEKNAGTTSQGLFTKTEHSIFGNCQTSYSIRDFKIIDSRRMWKKLGFNITKVIDMNNCTEADFEVFNKVVPGPNENQATNPLKSSGVIKHNILGTKDAFKIDEVRATGMHILYFTSKDDGGINSVTEQKLKLIRRLPHTMKRSKAIAIENNMQAESLSMNVKSFGNVERIPELSLADKRNIVKLVKAKMTVITKLVPTLESMDISDSHNYLQDVSTEVLHIIHILRTVDRRLHTTIWKECSKDTKSMKWLVYVYSLCGTQECTLFMQKTVTTLKEDEMISHYLWASSCNGNPTIDIVNSYKEILNSERVKSSADLTKMAYLSATNIIKTHCRQTVCNSTWVDEILIKALQSILTQCKNSKIPCHPLSRMPATVVIALAENIQRPGLFLHLKHIVLNESLPLDIRVRAVFAIRPLIKIIPNKVRPLMLRIFRERSYDKELRILSFSVLMDNPSVHVVLHVARMINNEPIRAIRRFVYDKWTAMRFAKVLSPQIDTAVKLGLELFSRHRLPSRLSSMTNCFNTKLFSDKFAVSAMLHHEEIYKTNFLPTLMHTKLNMTVLGRNISVLEAHLRVEGLEDYLGKLLGSKESLETKPSKKKPLGKISDILKTINEKLPQILAPEHEFKIFTQMSIFDKIFHVDEMSSNGKDDKTNTTSSLAERLMKLGSLIKKLEKGLEHKYSKPFIPVEVIYRMPSLVGVTMTANLTAMFLPVSVSKITLKTDPSLLSFMLMAERRINSMVINSEQKLCAIADVHGIINFRIPGLEVGAYMRKTLNVTAALKGKVKYDHKTGTFKSQMDTPETAKEIMTLRRKAYHYLKHDGKKMELKADKLPTEKIHRMKRHLGDEEEEHEDEGEFLKSSGFFYNANEATTSSVTKWQSTIATAAPTESLSMTPITSSSMPIDDVSATVGTAMHSDITTTATMTVGKPTTPSVQETMTLETTSPVTTQVPQSLSVTSSMSTSVKPTVIPGTTPVTPMAISKSEKERVETQNFLKIPIDLDGWKDVEVIGLEEEAPRWEEWMLKINEKFVTVQHGKVVLSKTPTALNVTFHGMDQRIVRLSLHGHGFLTIPAKSPCLIAKKDILDDGQYFVVTKHGPNLATIQAIAHLKPRNVPKDWSIANEEEIEFMEEMEELFQEEMFPLPWDNLNEEEKIEPTSQKARVTYWTTIGQSVCLTPMKNKASVVTTNIKTSRHMVLRRAAYQNGDCFGESFGIKVCLHGITPHPSLNHLAMAYSPMEYRLRVLPFSKRSGQISLKIVDKTLEEKRSGKSSLWTVILSNKAARVEKKIVIRGTMDWMEMNAAVEVTPSDIRGLEFTKLCLNLISRTDRSLFIASFDDKCRYKNLEVDVVSSKTVPGYWMTVNIKHRPKYVPCYVKEALNYVINNYVMPILHSTTSAYTNPHFGNEDTSSLDISLVRNDTIRLHLKTPRMSYLLNDVKLPTVLKSLPVGTPQIPMLAKMHHLIRPQCLHQGRTFVTFDKNEYQFVPRGKCDHTLLRICDKRRNNITVTMRKVDGTLKRAVTVLVDSKKIEVLPRRRMGLKPIIKINNSPLSFVSRHHILDTETKEKMLTLIWEPQIKCLTVKHHKYDLVMKLTRSYSSKDHPVLKQSVKDSKINLLDDIHQEMLATGQKLKPSLKRNSVSVRISPHFANKTCGLCGNYNGEKFDDFLTTEGTLVNDFRRPTSVYSVVKNSAAKIFASNWIMTGPKCTRDCSFTKTFVKMLKPGKVCLTNYRIAHCPCKRKGHHDMVAVPATCVPPSMAKALKKFLTDGTPMDLSRSTEILAKIKMPKDCKCNC